LPDAVAIAQRRARKAPWKSAKRQPGIELTYRTNSGAKIVATFPWKVSDAEIREALQEAAGEIWGDSLRIGLHLMRAEMH
jgi:hypothetical protein